MDLASEEIVDHLTDEPALNDVAEKTHLIEIAKSTQSLNAVFDMHLDDGRIYEVILDAQGNLVRKSFK